MRKPMSLQHRLKLKKNHVRLVNEMQAEYMIPYFIQESVLTYEMADVIRNTTTEFSRNEKLLNMLPQRGDSAYRTLIAALRYGSGQLHLVDLMENTSILIEELNELEDELSRRSQHSVYSPYYDDDNPLYDSVQNSRLTSRIGNNQNPSRLAVPVPAKKAKTKRTRKSQKHLKHREELPDIQNLFPYIVPHVHKKWSRLAQELGLSDKDLNQIVIIPHEKQSRYARMVLDIWLNKDRSKATKSKLSQALEAIGAKKALDAISIYKVPKFKAKLCPKAFVTSINTETIPLKHNMVPGIQIVRSTPKIDAKAAYINLSSAIRRSGHLPIRCQVEKVESQQNLPIDQTQKAFLSLADKITDSMIEQGEQATQILNSMERLQGIMFHKVYKGSVILETQVLHLRALERLMELYSSKELAAILEEVFVTRELLTQFKASDVLLTVNISETDYQQCRLELMALVNNYKTSTSDSEIVSCYTSDQTDETESEDEAFEWDHTFECSGLIRDVRQELSHGLAQFDQHVSEFLMTLQMVHPPDVTRISTINDLITFRGYLQTAATLSTAAIDKFIEMHQLFADKVTSLRSRISTTLYVSRKLAPPSIQLCTDELMSIQRMLQPGYDFSALTHARTVTMTTLETLCYRGLLSSRYVILDKLANAEQHLHSN